MPRYFLSLRYKEGPHGLAVDDEGDELPDASGLRAHVLDTAGDMLDDGHIQGVNWLDCTFEVTDETGRLVMTMPFTEAVP